MRKYLRSRSFWLSFFASLTTIFIFTTGIFIYNWQADVASGLRSARSENDGAIYEISKYVDDIFKDLLILTKRLSATEWVSKLSADSEVFNGSFNYVRQREITSDFLFHTGQNDAVTKIFLVYPYKDICIGERIWADAYSFFGNLGLRGNYRLTILDSVRAVNELTVLDKNFTAQIPMFVMPVENISNSRVFLCGFLNTANISAAIGNIMPGGVTAMRAVNAVTGEVLLSRGVYEPKTSDRIVNRESLYIDWSYEFVIDDWVATVDYAQSRRYLPGFFILAAIFGVLAAGVLSVILYRPMAKLMARIFNPYPSRIVSEYKAIGEHIDRITERYNQSRYVILINKLLSGFFEKHDLYLLEAGIPFNDAGFHKVFICENASGLTAGQRGETYLTLDYFFKEQHIPYAVQESIDGALIVITAFADETPANQINAVPLNDLLKNQYAIFAGNAAPGLLGISISYQSAREHRGYFTGIKPPRYYLPLDWENQFIDALYTGNHSVANNILEQIRCENERRFNDEKFTGSDYYRLFGMLVNDMKRAAGETDLPENIYEIYGKNADTVWKTLLAVCGNICVNRNNKTNAGRNILTYLDAHYTNNDLSLSYLENAFGLNAGTINKNIREIEGVTFHTYLTRLRITRARELLADGNLKISQVAQTVGYDNEYSFRRAFYRMTGVKAQDYRA